MSHLAAANKYFSPDVVKSYVNNLRFQLAYMAHRLCKPGEHVTEIKGGMVLESFPGQRELVVTIEGANGSTRKAKLYHPLKMYDEQWLDRVCTSQQQAE